MKNEITINKLGLAWVLLSDESKNIISSCDGNAYINNNYDEYYDLEVKIVKETLNEKYYIKTFNKLNQAIAFANDLNLKVGTQNEKKH